MKIRAVQIHALLTLTLAASCSLAAQTPSVKQTESPATKEIREEFYSAMNNIRSSADKMPESDYAFKPMPGMRSFAELMIHIGDVESHVCRTMLRNPKAAPTIQGMSKAAVQKVLASSFDDCYEAVSELSAENENRPVATPLGERARIAAIAMVLAHNNEEYGYMSVHLRLKGIVPSTTSGDAAKEYKGK
jgi:hypothetical protein